MSGCCTPSRRADQSERSDRPSAAGTPGLPPPELVAIAGGTTLVGSNDPEHPEEWPVREVEVEAFRIAACAVTNAEFAQFVAATGYRTEAESFGSSFVFAGFLPDDFPPTRGVAEAPWWREVLGASWAHPMGPHSGLSGVEDHPVVHVSRTDAEAYAEWRGARLPSEIEWEHAARGGLVDQPFPWGSALQPDGQHRMNVWQGTFPGEDTGADGWRGTCPVDAFPANGFGLHNPTGNVWEWCAGDWATGAPGGSDGVTRGGSYLCHASYCRGYRVSARQRQATDSSAGNLGFRLAADA